MKSLETTSGTGQPQSAQSEESTEAEISQQVRGSRNEDFLKWCRFCVQMISGDSDEFRFLRQMLWVHADVFVCLLCSLRLCVFDICQYSWIYL